MTDESIGTLWSLYRDDKTAEGKVIRGLIKNLVDERIRRYSVSPSYTSYVYTKALVLSEYGIDLSKWEEKP